MNRKYKCQVEGCDFVGNKMAHNSHSRVHKETINLNSNRDKKVYMKGFREGIKWAEENLL